MESSKWNDQRAGGVGERTFELTEDVKINYL